MPQNPPEIHFFREVAKREKGNLAVRLTGVSYFPPIYIEQMIRGLLGPGEKYVRVWQHGAGAHVELGNPFDKQTLLNFSGRRSNLGHTLFFTLTKP